MIRAFVTSALVFILAGCATRSTPRVYYNPYIDDGVLLQRQFTIDDGYCVSASAGAVPIPQVRLYNPQPQAYTFSGQITTYNPYTGYTTSEYRGTAQPYPSPGNAFATGFANGMNIGAAMAARRDRDRVYHACMLALGWTANRGEVAYLRSVFEAKKKAATTPAPSPPPAPDYSAAAASLDSIDLDTQDTINSIPELAMWQRNDAAEWDLAVKIDKHFIEMPRYSGKATRDRLLDVVREVKAQMRAHK